MAVGFFDIRLLKNPTWQPADVQNQYSDANAHADLYRYINQWSDMEMYLNVGYTRWWQRHNCTANHLRLIDRLADTLAEWHKNSPHAGEKRLVDIASGRGGAAIRAFQKYGWPVMGIDFTKNNIRLATANAKKYGVWPQVQFHMGDAHQLPLADKSVALAWSIESPAHFKDKPRFLREVSRILKPGGIFAMSELLVNEHIVAASKANEKVYENFLSVWDVPYLESYSGYLKAMHEADLAVKNSEIATRFNLDIYQRYCRWFLAMTTINPLYQSYKNSIRKKINADLDNVLEHTFHSYQALKLGMIDYGLFWAVKE